VVSRLLNTVENLWKRSLVFPQSIFTYLLYPQSLSGYPQVLHSFFQRFSGVFHRSKTEKLLETFTSEMIGSAL